MFRSIQVLTLAAACGALPLLILSPRPPERIIHFSGYDWSVKNTGWERRGPGPNYFLDDAVELVPEGLKLKVVERNGAYYCAEVICLRSMGYGTYRFTLGSNLDDLAPHLVLGMFTWSDDPRFSNREMDVEISRWGDPRDSENGQFSVQPAERPGNSMRFVLPAGEASTVYSFTWLPESISFRCERRDGSVVASHTFSHGIPEPGAENARINLWSHRGSMPGPGTAHVIITKFEFVPALGSFSLKVPPR